MTPVDDTCRRFLTHLATTALGSIVCYAQPYRELELLALAKAYQDRAGWHTRRPAALGA